MERYSLHKVVFLLIRDSLSLEKLSLFKVNIMILAGRDRDFEGVRAKRNPVEDNIRQNCSFPMLQILLLLFSHPKRNIYTEKT